MGQFSMVIYTPPGSLLSGNQQSSQQNQTGREMPFDSRTVPLHQHSVTC